MKVEKCAGIIPLLLFLYGSCTSQDVTYLYIKDLTSSASAYIHDFRQVSEMVNKRYTHLDDKRISGSLLQDKYSNLVKHAQTNLEYGDILLRYFAELNNGHSGVVFRRYFKNCSAMLIRDRIFLAHVGDSHFINAGILAKDEIIKINNVPVMDYLLEQTRYISASTDLHKKYMSVSYLFSSYFEETRVYTIQTSGGEKTITVEFKDTPSLQNNATRPSSRIEAKVLNQNVAYISILGMTGVVVDDFASAFDTLAHLPFLIIDLRRNQGGNSGHSERIAEYLLTTKHEACVSKRWLTPKSNHYKGQLFVLISPFTFSAAESFVIDLLEGGNVTLVGMPTGGDTGNQPRIYQSDLGYSYRFPSRHKAQVSGKGFPMEGRSIEPHHVVDLTVSDFMDGRDTVLNYALDLINRK